MKKLLIIDNLEQLKSISDPFRLELMEMIAKTPKTGQMLADELALPRAKVHYHLNQLLAHNIIRIARTETKNSIIQKFYQPVAEKIILNIDILNYKKSDNKKDKQSYKIKLDEDEYNDFKKDLKDFVKKRRPKKETATANEYTVQILPYLREV